MTEWRRKKREIVDSSEQIEETITITTLLPETNENL